MFAQVREVLIHASKRDIGALGENIMFARVREVLVRASKRFWCARREYHVCASERGIGSC